MPTITTEINSPKPAVIAEVEKLVYGGDGLARVEGEILLTPFVLPGEQIEVTTKREKAGLLRGRSPKIIRPSEGRTVPRCEYFANCGGCHYQHAEYDLQLEAKRGILQETLRRLGGITYEGEIGTVRGTPWNYRNRIQLHSNERHIGFRKAESHDLCPITHCEISSPALNDAIAKLSQAVQQKEWPSFLRTIELFTNEDQMQLSVVESMRPVAARFFAWCETLIPSLVPDPLNYRVADHSFRISRGSFFQVNRFLIQDLVAEALRGAEGKTVLDLYAGVGLFSLPLAQRFTEVMAVERSAPAFRDLEWNAAQSSGNIRSERMTAEAFLQQLADTPDLIVADPPRAGLGKEATEQILRLLPPRLTYVSCDIATLARDLRKLTTVYAIDRLTLVDLFPQTYHFESVVHLRRK
jgi:23S rRNA (uracil1939-C5)-methyltransferase